MLYFFLTTIHDVYNNGDATTAKVIYHPETSQKLISGKNIQLEISDYYEMFESEYKGYQATTKKINSCPAFNPIIRNQYMFRGPAAALHTKEDFLFLDTS